jgi:site-specific DNA-methyltransferase (adenine-specific)
MLPNVMISESNLSHYIKVREAAAMLGVHPDTLRRWETSGKLNTYRHPINRYRLYRRHIG